MKKKICLCLACLLAVSTIACGKSDKDIQTYTVGNRDYITDDTVDVSGEDDTKSNKSSDGQTAENETIPSPNASVPEDEKTKDYLGYDNFTGKIVQDTVAYEGFYDLGDDYDMNNQETSLTNVQAMQQLNSYIIQFVSVDLSSIQYCDDADTYKSKYNMELKDVIARIKVNMENIEYENQLVNKYLAYDDKILALWKDLYDSLNNCSTEISNLKATKIVETREDIDFSSLVTRAGNLSEALQSSIDATNVVQVPEDVTDEQVVEN